MFSERGYKGTSIRDIANALGVSVSNIYHYFENKEAMWLAILEYSVTGMPEKLAAAARLELSPLESFKALVKAHLAMSAFHQMESRIFLIDQDRLSPAGMARNRDIQQRILDVYVDALEGLRAAGYVHTEHIKILAFNVLGVINWYLRWYRADGPLPPDRVYEEIAQFVLFGAAGCPPVEAKPAKSGATRRSSKK